MKGIEHLSEERDSSKFEDIPVVCSFLPSFIRGRRIFRCCLRRGGVLVFLFGVSSGEEILQRVRRAPMSFILGSSSGDEGPWDEQPPEVRIHGSFLPEGGNFPGDLILDR
jgi:hypothetical protein